MKKIIALLLSALMLTSVFSGCGTKEKKEGEAKTDEKGKVELFQLKREAVDTFNKMIEDFQKENAGITIEQNNVPDGDKVLPTRMASDDTPAIFTQWPATAEFRAQVKDGYVLDLSNESFVKNISENVINDCAIDGKTYALPISLNTMGVFYNVKMFNDLGIKVPTTYGELIDACKKIKAAGKTPIVFADKDAWTCGQTMELFYGNFMKDANATFKDAMDGKKHLNDNAELKNVAAKVLELHQYSKEDPLGTSYDDATRAFANEQAAMFIQGIWDIPSIKKANPNIEFAMFPMPADKAEDTKVVVGVDLALAVSSNTKSKDSALKFLNYMADPKNAQKYAELDGSVSAVKGVKCQTKESAVLVDMLNQNKTFSWAEANWALGVAPDHQKAAQNLIAQNSADGFLKDMDSVFFGKAKK